MMGAEKIYETWFKNIFGPILTRFGVPENEQPLIMIFYLKGIIGVVTEWVRGGCSESKEEITSKKYIGFTNQHFLQNVSGP